MGGSKIERIAKLHHDNVWQLTTCRCPWCLKGAASCRSFCLNAARRGAAIVKAFPPCIEPAHSARVKFPLCFDSHIVPRLQCLAKSLLRQSRSELTLALQMQVVLEAVADAVSQLILFSVEADENKAVLQKITQGAGAVSKAVQILVNIGEGTNSQSVISESFVVQC